jgi:hypothetical protein
MNILQYILHLWSIPPVGLTLACPAAPVGQTTNPTGLFDDAAVHAAFTSAAMWSAVVIAVLIPVCYLATRKASGPKFDRRWLYSMISAGVTCALVSYAVLAFAPTTAAANTCESNPNAFLVSLPSGVVMRRTIAGLVWGLLAFVVGSFLGTRIFGWYPSLRNGFYHSRGTPWPRMSPGRK